MQTLLTFVLLLSFQFVFAQEDIKKTIPAQNSENLRLYCEYGDVTIESWNNKSIEITGSFLVNGNTQNDVLNITHNIDDGAIKINILADLKNIDEQKTIITSDGNKIYLKPVQSIESLNLKDKVFSQYIGTDVDASFTIKIPQNMLIKTKMKYGNYIVKDYFDGMCIESTYGSITGTFNQLPKEPLMSFESKYDFVDISIPQSTNAELRLETEYGSVYTDLEFKPEYNRNKNVHGETIIASLNKGGKQLSLKSDYDNIYLRRSK